MGITDPPIVVLGFVVDVVNDDGIDVAGCCCVIVVVPCKDGNIVIFDAGCDDVVCKYPVVVVVGCGVVVSCTLLLLLLLLLLFCSVGVVVRWVC